MTQGWWFYVCVTFMHLFFFFNFVLLFNKVSRSSLKVPENVNSFNTASPGHHLLHLGERGDCDSKKACVFVLRFGPFCGLASQETVSEETKSTPDPLVHISTTMGHHAPILAGRFGQFILKA